MRDSAALKITALDTSRQKSIPISIGETSPRDTIGDLIEAIVPEMELPEEDSNGRSLSYQAFSEREGRHLNRTDLISDLIEQKVLKPEDELVLNPEIQAGL